MDFMDEIMKYVFTDLKDEETKEAFQSGEKLYYRLNDSLAIVSMKERNLSVEVIGCKLLPITTGVFL